MSDLSDAQMLAVGDVFKEPDAPAVPCPTLESLNIHELGVRVRDYRLPMPPKEEDQERFTLGGWCAVYQSLRPLVQDVFTRRQPEGPEELCWFSVNQTRGGGSGTSYCRSREEAVQHLLRYARMRWKNWEHRVTQMRNGDLTDDGKPIIRCGGSHYILGDCGRNIRGAGFGGSQFMFRMLDTGRVLISRDVWFQGDVPLEYRDILVDNAELVKL